MNGKSYTYKEVRVQATAGAKKEFFESIRDASGVLRFRIAVREPKEQGRANARILALLSLHFHVPTSRPHCSRNAHEK